MPHYAVFDLGLHCLPMSLLGDARHKWANTEYRIMRKNIWDWQKLVFNSGVVLFSCITEVYCISHQQLFKSLEWSKL